MSSFLLGSGHDDGSAAKRCTEDVCAYGNLACPNGCQDEVELDDDYPGDQPAAQTSERDLLSTTDAQVWARAFIERFAGRMVSAGDVDEGLMISWFANAIETGREAGRKLISIPTEEDDDGSDW